MRDGPVHFFLRSRALRNLTCLHFLHQLGTKRAKMRSSQIDYHATSRYIRKERQCLGIPIEQPFAIEYQVPVSWRGHYLFVDNRNVDHDTRLGAFAAIKNHSRTFRKMKDWANSASRRTGILDLGYWGERKALQICEKRSWLFYDDESETGNDHRNRNLPPPTVLADFSTLYDARTQ